MKRSDSVAFVGLLCVYLAISLHHLDTVPMVYEDEPWESSTGWKLANEGVFGSDMFEGWHGMEHHCYAFMPLHPMMLALFFRMLGLGVAQARVETVFVGLAVLVGTFYLGRRLFGPPVGLLSLLFLLCVRLTGTNPSSVSGILFLDMARIARYDMFVPALGIAALHSWLSARDSGRWWSFVGTGFLIGLSALGHLYGVFWVPVIGVLTIWERGVRASLLPLLWMMLGFLVPWLPYMAYVSADIESWVGQTNEYFLEGRFNVLDPLWYLDNLVLEPDRYKVGLRSATPLAMVGRIGLWCTLIILPASIVGLIRSGDRSARVVWVSAVLLPLCFALTIHIKMMNYIVTFMPLWAIAIAWGLLFLWERLGYWGRRGWQ